jgi:hypothetical protein
VTLTYAGKPLLFPDADARLQEWLDRYCPFEDLLPAATPAMHTDGRGRPQGHWPHAIGLPRFNWQLRPPRWRLNSLWWPTGASRFALGLFVVDEATADYLFSFTSQFKTLQIDSLEVSMAQLPMLPISSEFTDNCAYLLPLVDARYFWQWSKIDPLTLNSQSSWADVRSAITTGLGIAVTAAAPDAAYPAPDWSEWTRQAENAALALDAYAATVGQRFVAKLDGTYHLQNWEDVVEVAFANHASVETIVGDQVFSRNAGVPGQVTIAFPRRQGGIAQQNGAVELITKSAGDYHFVTANPGRAVIHTTFQADFSSRSSGADNATAMNDLAGAIAADFYGWRRAQYGVTAAGILNSNNWNVTGYDDALWFFYGTQLPSGDMLGHTRIESLPVNFGTSENLAQDPATDAPRTFRPCPVWRVELTSGWTAGTGSQPDYATARLLYDGSGSPPTGVLSTDGHDVTIFDTLELRGDSVVSGSKVWVAALPHDSNMFELITAKPGVAPVRFRLTATLNTGSSAAAVLRSFNGTTYVDGDAIVVFDWWSIAGGGRGMWQAPSSAEGWAIRRELNATPAGDPEYDIVWMEQIAKAVEFTLTGDLAGGYATATVTASWDQGIEPGASITVHDDQGRWTDAITGCKGTAWRSEYADPTNPATPYYKIISCTRAVRDATATLNADMCGDVPVVTAWGPRAIGEHQVDPGQGTLLNPRGHYGQSGDEVKLERTNNAPPFTWEVVDVTLHAIEVPVEFRYHEESCQIQVRKQQIAIERCGPAGDWETLLQMTELEYATGASITTTGVGQDCTLRVSMAKMCGFHIDEAVAPVDLVMQRVDPLLDIYVTGTQIMGIHVPMWVFCTDDVYEAEIHDGTDCEGGSGE